MENINYSNLVAKGRAKAHGVPWSESEWATIIATPETERPALIAKLRGVVEAPKEEPKVETPEVPVEEPKEESVAKPKAKRAVKVKK
jgi:hypothetical protein